MTSKDIFRLADLCIEAGCYPDLVDRRYILIMQIDGLKVQRIHRKQVTFRLWVPCRVWLMSGSVRVLLGDSDALPVDLAEGVRPPWTM